MIAVDALAARLMPLAEVITPNIPETEVLLGHPVTTAAEMETAARALHAKYGCAVLVKGGHSIHDADDCLFDGASLQWMHGERIANPNTHGTGCTLSSAIASGLAKGHGLTASVSTAKRYISGALAAMLDLGHGSGPLHHGFDIHSGFTK